jgi:haloalkane dehalogenase
MTTIIRTPEERFAGLPDFPFAPHWHDTADGMRIHYVDEGPRDGRPVLMLHGEPTWSYLYRHMIPPVVSAGHRVLAPDLIGFGKSDKSVDRSRFTYAAHVGWMRDWVEARDLTGIILVCQDWGSLVGLRLLTAMPERFAGVAIANGGLPAGGGAPLPFRLWRAFSRYSPFFRMSRIVQAGTKRRFSDAEKAAYDAPFHVEAAKAAARVFPSLVPVGNDDPALPDQRAAWAVLEQWDKPFLCCYSDGDPITRGADRPFLERVPGARGQPHRTLRGGHFVQEDDPAGFVGAILDITQQLDGKDRA